jgi:hypothetical protein
MMGKDNNAGDLEETRRIMERLVRTPPKPHKGDGKTTGKKVETPAKPTPKRAPVKRRGKSD